MPNKLGEGPLLVDASFVLGVLLNEQQAVRFTDALARASIVDVNLGEVFYKLAEKAPTPPERIGNALLAKGLTVISAGPSGAAQFPKLKKADFAYREQCRKQGWPESDIKSLSLADIVCLGTALARSLMVLTGDKHWKTLNLDLTIEDYRDPDLVP